MDHLPGSEYCNPPDASQRFHGEYPAHNPERQALIFIIGGCFQTAAQDLSWLYGGRSIAGLGVGFLVMIIPVYQGEIAHPSIRGRVTALQQFMLGIGSFIAGWLSYGTFPISNTGAFRSKYRRGVSLRDPPRRSKRCDPSLAIYILNLLKFLLGSRSSPPSSSSP